MKKIRLFLDWIKKIKSNKNDLSITYNLRIDKAFRLYTVLNIPEELVGDSYALKKSDIDKICENYVREYTKRLSEFLNKSGLQELYQIYEIKKVEKYSYLIVIGFSLFKSHRFLNWIYFAVSPIILIASIIMLFLIL